jgi:hypothetical protein
MRLMPPVVSILAELGLPHHWKCRSHETLAWRRGCDGFMSESLSDTPQWQTCHIKLPISVWLCRTGSDDNYRR